MKKFIYSIAVITFYTQLSAQSQQTLSVQPEKVIKGTPATTTLAAKDSNPNTPVEPAITYSTITTVPSTSLDPNITPSVSAVEPKKTEPKKTQPKSDPK